MNSEMLKPAIVIAVFLYNSVSLICLLIVKDCEEIIFYFLPKEKIWFNSPIVNSKDKQFLSTISRAMYADAGALRKTVFLKI